MNRLSIAFVAALAAGCGAQQFPSVCDDANAPASCGQTCDARPGAPATCGAGLYCTEDGVCNAQCGPTQSCPDGYECTSDGRCTDDPTDNDPGIVPDASCPSVTFTPEPVTPSILLVLDRSGSMARGIQNSGPSKYSLMTAALTGPMGVVTGLQDKAYFGAANYGCGSGSNVLGTPVPRALNNASAINTHLLAGPNQPSGNTPTPEAITQAVATFTATPPPAGSPPVIVLATDGEPNTCPGPEDNARQRSVNAAATSFAAGIPVYVLALDVNGNHFQDLANAGGGHVAGQPNLPYYPAANAAQLQAAFQTIINGVISCDLTLTSSIAEQQAQYGIVTINGVQIQYGTDWTLVNGDTIRVQGAACDALKTATNPQVEAEFPCGAVIL